MTISINHVTDDLTTSTGSLKVNGTALATVATSGSYADLTSKPLTKTSDTVALTTTTDTLVVGASAKDASGAIAQIVGALKLSRDSTDGVGHQIFHRTNNTFKSLTVYQTGAVAQWYIGQDANSNDWTAWAYNGTSLNQSFLISNATGKMDFKVQPSFNGTDLPVTNATNTFTTKQRIPAVEQSVVALGSISGTHNIDLNTAGTVTATITGATTFTFSNAPSAGRDQVVYLKLTNAGSAAITFPVGTKYVGGAAPAFTAAGKDLLGIWYDVEQTAYVVVVLAKDYK